MTALTCRDFIDLLSAHVAADLPAERLATFEAHLAQCPACVDYLQTYKDTVTLAKGAFRPRRFRSGSRAGRAGASHHHRAAKEVIRDIPDGVGHPLYLKDHDWDAQGQANLWMRLR